MWGVPVPYSCRAQMGRWASKHKTLLLMIYHAVKRNKSLVVEPLRERLGVILWCPKVRSSPTTAEPVRGASKCRAWCRCFASWSLESAAPHSTPPTNILWVNNTPYVTPIVAIPSVEKTSLLPGTPWISRILVDAQTCSNHKLHRLYSYGFCTGPSSSATISSEFSSSMYLNSGKHIFLGWWFEAHEWYITTDLRFRSFRCFIIPLTKTTKHYILQNIYIITQCCTYVSNRQNQCVARKIHLVAISNTLQIIFHVELRAHCSASLSRSPNSVLRCVANMWRMVESFSAVKQVNIYVHI